MALGICSKFQAIGKMRSPSFCWLERHFCRVLGCNNNAAMLPFKPCQRWWVLGRTGFDVGSVTWCRCFFAVFLLGNLGAYCSKPLKIIKFQVLLLGLLCGYRTAAWPLAWAYWSWCYSFKWWVLRHWSLRNLSHFMSTLQIGLLFGASTCLVLFSGMPIAFALGSVATVFMYFFMLLKV